jgi:hypothetical protein
MRSGVHNDIRAYAKADPNGSYWLSLGSYSVHIHYSYLPQIHTPLRVGLEQFEITLYWEDSLRRERSETITLLFANKE